MAGDIEEAGVRFIVENLESYLAQVKLANGATTGIGDGAEAAAAKHGIAWKAIGTAAVAGAAVITAAVVGAGLAALKFAGDFDAAFDTIQVTTGATGPALDALKESFKTVFSSIPADGGDIALAMSAIAQKTGATGPALETLTAQIVELSRITGTDLNANIEAVLGATQRWGVSAEGAAPMLDHLFRVAQESGVPVAELAQGLQDNKAVLDALGLTLPQSAELIGSLGKAGVDSDTAFQGLTIALRKMAKDGIEDPQAEIEKYFKQIKNAKTDAEATAIGVKIFGRSAVELSSAIRDGSFDMEKFSKAVKENKNGIIDSARATDDWREKLDIMKNRLLVAIEPALTSMFTALSDGLDKVGPLMERFSAWFSEEIQPAITEAAAVFKSDWLPIIERVGQTLQEFWSAVAQPILLGLVENVRAVAAVFKEAAQVIGAIIDGDFSAAFEHLKAMVAEMGNAIVTIMTNWAGAFLTVGLYVFGKIVEAVDAVAGDAIRAVVGFLGDAVTAITSFAGAMLSAGRELFEAVLAGIMSVPILSAVIGVGVTIANAVAGWAGGMFERGYNVLIAVLDGLKSAWSAIVDWASSLPSLDDLLPDNPFGGMDLKIPVTPEFIVVEPLNPNWLLDWFSQWQDKERQAELLREAWQAWLDQHPLEITPTLKPAIPKMMPIPIPDELEFDNISVPQLRLDYERWLEDHPLDVTPTLKPDIPKMLDFSIPTSSDWLLEWFQKQQDAERLREQMEEAMNAWLAEHPLDITPAMRIKIPDFWKPLVDPELSKRPKKPGDPIVKPKPGNDGGGGGGGTTDPGSLLALVLQAIATIEAIAASDLAPVSQAKLLGIAQSLRAIVIQFSQAMKGIEPEAVEAAALIADFINPILQAINASVDILSNEAISKFTGANLQGFKVLLQNMAELALAASQTIGALNIEGTAGGAVAILQSFLNVMGQAFTVLSDERFSKFTGANLQGYKVLLQNMAELSLAAAQTLGSINIDDAAASSVAAAGRIIGSLGGSLGDAFELLIDPRFGSFGGANMQGYRVLFQNIAELTQIGIDTLAGFDVATVQTVDEILAVLARMIKKLQDIIPQPGPGPGPIPQPGPGPIPQPGPGPEPGPVPVPDPVWSRISGSLPGVGATLAGLPGGVTYQVNAVYTNPQTPQSIRLDLLEMAMRASAS